MICRTSVTHVGCGGSHVLVELAARRSRTARVSNSFGWTNCIGRKFFHAGSGKELVDDIFIFLIGTTLPIGNCRHRVPVVWWFPKLSRTTGNTDIPAPSPICTKTPAASRSLTPGPGCSGLGLRQHVPTVQFSMMPTTILPISKQVLNPPAWAVGSCSAY